jgi:hypothetical protein
VADDESSALDVLVARMVAQFPTVAPDTVRTIVTAKWDEFTDKPIRVFVPVLVERSARNHLRSRYGAGPLEA